jgi:ornithine cyclodeaminase/alanine dehydrogenase-like protein (mu-crystallin family)
MLTWQDTIQSVRDSFRAAATGRILAPAAAQVPTPNGSLHLKAGGLLDPSLLSVKANLRPDAGRALGVILLFDPDGVTLRAVLESAEVTAYRTAATAVVAAGALGTQNNCSVAVLGTGRVAGAVIEALLYEINVSAFHLWGRNREHAEQLAHANGSSVPVYVHDTPGGATAHADVVVTCTPSRSPLIEAADLRDGALVLAMGADSPGKRELADDVLAGAIIVADDPVAVTRVGETAFLPDSATSDAVLGDLGSLLTGAVTLPGGTARVVFDSVGIAFVDTAVAALLLKKAEANGLGTPFHFTPPVGH